MLTGSGKCTCVLVCDSNTFLFYDNTRHTKIAKQLAHGGTQLTAHQEEHNTMGDTSFTSHLEGMALRGETVVGGSGYVEATVRDMGSAEDKTEGAKGTSPAEKRKRQPRKGKEEGGALLGLAEIETDPRGDPSINAPSGPGSAQLQRGAHARGENDTG